MFYCICFSHLTCGAGKASIINTILHFTEEESLKKMSQLPKVMLSGRSPVLSTLSQGFVTIGEGWVGLVGAGFLSGWGLLSLCERLKIWNFCNISSLFCFGFGMSFDKSFFFPFVNSLWKRRVLTSLARSKLLGQIQCVWKNSFFSFLPLLSSFFLNIFGTKCNNRWCIIVPLDPCLGELVEWAHPFHSYDVGGGGHHLWAPLWRHSVYPAQWTSHLGCVLFLPWGRKPTQEYKF